MGVPNNHPGFILPILLKLALQVLSDIQYETVKGHVFAHIATQISSNTPN